MRIHQDRSPLAGQVIRIKADAKHHLYNNFAGAEFKVVDWFDRVYKRSVHGWAYCPTEVIVFEARWGRFLAGYVPYGQEDEVLVGTILGNIVIVHLSELELTQEACSL